MAERLGAQTDNGRQPTVTTLVDAEFWIGVMHRRTCSDAARLYELSERIRRLEQPWWRRRRVPPPGADERSGGDGDR